MEGPNYVHYNYHTSNQCNTSSPSLTEGQSDFHYNVDIKSMGNIITTPYGGAKLPSMIAQQIQWHMKQGDSQGDHRMWIYLRRNNSWFQSAGTCTAMAQG